ncbi:MAG TPA: site-specific integrase, partial [Mycobacterium sp.]
MHYGPDGSTGRRYKAPTTFTNKKAARQWLSIQQADIVRGKWLPPGDQAPAPPKVQTLKDYADVWLRNRLVDGEPLKDLTRYMYRQMLDLHILPTLGNLPVSSITADDVAKWHATTLTKRPTYRARCYALLRTILTTAVTDG